jgi:hypothetical protein
VLLKKATLSASTKALLAAPSFSQANAGQKKPLQDFTLPTVKKYRDPHVHQCYENLQAKSSVYEC